MLQRLRLPLKLAVSCCPPFLPCLTVFVPAFVAWQCVVGLAGKLVGWIKQGELYPDLSLIDCLPLQPTTRRPDVVAMLLQLAKVVDDPDGETAQPEFDFTKLVEEF